MIRQNRNIVLLIILTTSIGFSCKKEKEDIIIMDKATFSAKIDGTDVLLTESEYLTDPDNYISWNPSLSINIGKYDYNINILSLSLGQLVTSSFNVSNLISINFVDHIYPSQFDDNNNLPQSIFENIVSEGSKEYTKNRNESPGVFITWYDTEGTEWSTADIFLAGTTTYVNIDHIGDEFEIVKSIPQSDTADKWQYYQYLELDFECKLYNNIGDSIFLKSGKLKGLYKISNQPS